ncbi:MAG: hypothetical protein IKT40_07340 [Bacilli bacterium]|nr:hypothetical protein [Bacilli bacterium]
MLRKTTEEFIKEARLRHGDKYDYSKVNYINTHTKICIICPIHGEFYQIPKLHISGSKCPKCSYIERGDKCRKTFEEFIKDAKLIHGDKYDYSKVEYINAKTKVCIVCPKHGEFLQTPNDHLIGKGCPICNESKLEIKIKKFLLDNNIEFEYQKKFDWFGKQSLDFYIPNNNIAIECQGKQHFGYGGWTNKFDFDKLFELDMLKNKLCAENGINLIYFSDNIDYDQDKYSFYKKNIYFSTEDIKFLT